MYTKTNNPWVNGPTNPINADALNNIENGIVNQYEWITKSTGDPDDLVVNNRQVFVDTTGGVYTLTLPSTPSVGDSVKFVDVAGQFGTNKFTVNVASGDKLMGVVDDFLELVADYDFVRLVYSGVSYGWVITEKP